MKLMTAVMLLVACACRPAAGVEKSKKQIEMEERRAVALKMHKDMTLKKERDEEARLERLTPIAPMEDPPLVQTPIYDPFANLCVAMPIRILQIVDGNKVLATRMMWDVQLGSERPEVIAIDFPSTDGLVDGQGLTLTEYSEMGTFHYEGTGGGVRTVRAFEGKRPSE